MCKYWGINENTYNHRRARGWSLRDSLEKEAKDNQVIDHLGNKFLNMVEMCKYWGVEYSVFYNRIREGWSLEREP